jgi:hypothetical protein
MAKNAKITKMTLQELFDQNVGLEQHLEDNNVTFSDYDVEVESLSAALQESIGNGLKAIAVKPTKDAETIAYNKLSQSEKFAIIVANLLKGKDAESVLKAKYEKAYVRLGTISNLPSNAARDKKEGAYDTKQGEGYLIISDVIKADTNAKPFDDDAIQAIKREQKLSVAQFAYLLDLKELGVEFARTEINIESRKYGGVRRYRLEDLISSITGKTGKFASAQLQKEVENLFALNAVGQGDEKRLIVTLPDADSDSEAKFYPFKTIERGAKSAVAERFAIRERVAVKHSTQAEAIAEASMETDVMLAKIARMQKAGLDNALIAMLVK